MIDNEFVNRRLFLRIKFQSLAEEARIIRRMKRKQNGATKMALNEHRRLVLRPKARAVSLALGFLRGREYAQMESPNYERKGTNPPDWDEIRRLVKKYGGSQRSAVVLEKLDSLAG